MLAETMNGHKGFRIWVTRRVSHEYYRIKVGHTGVGQRRRPKKAILDTRNCWNEVN